MFCVGTKIDLRDDKEVVGQLAAQGLSPVKREQGIKLASKIRVYKYLECSALTQRGLRQVRLVTGPTTGGSSFRLCHGGGVRGWVVHCSLFVCPHG